MIQRRRKPENTQENNEQERPSLKNRKEAMRTGNRFSYQLENLNTEKDDDESIRHRTKYYHDYSISDKQTNSQNYKQATKNRPNQKQSKKAPLKKDYLYQENSIGSLYCSRKNSNYYQRYNSTQREDFHNVSLQYETTPFNRTPIFPSVQISSTTIDQFNPHQSDIELQYQQIWANNQRQKQQTRYSTLRQPLAEKQESRQNIVVNTRKSISKNTLNHQERSASLRSQQNHESGANTHRHYHQASYLQVDNSLQTRKTSPTRCKDKVVVNTSEQVTLRSSPNRTIQPLYTNSLPAAQRRMADQTQVNIRLVDEFASRIQSRIQELSFMLVELKCVR